MIEVKRKEGENSLSVLRRFTKKVKQSGNIQIVKGLRFNKRGMSELEEKRSAIRRIENQKNYELKKKLGLGGKE